MKRTYELDENEIKQAIQLYLHETHGIDGSVADVRMTVTEKYDALDRKTGGADVTATISMES